jgi:glycosyltransferase involved in cell wall biosynthesis
MARLKIAIYDRWVATLGGGERLCLAVADHLSKAHDVTFFSAQTAPLDEIARKLNVRPGRVQFEVVKSADLPAITSGFDVFINASQGDFIPSSASRNVMLVYFPAPIHLDAAARARAALGGAIKQMLKVPSPAEPANDAGPRYRLYQTLIESRHPELSARLRAVPDDATALPRILDGYQHVWAISAYTAKWVKRLWQRDCAVLTPIVDVEAFGPSEKRQQIVSVGRFFAGNHNKKHLEMIAAFRALNVPCWELHLAGGTLPQPEHQVYLRCVREAAQGGPIRIHTDASFDALKKLYAESAIYWHAAGMGEDEARDPIKAEHFGITTVEAMAAGCVPVVINKGGQPEIIQHERNGLLWGTVSELQSQTQRLMADDALRSRLALQARADSQQYDRAHFEQRLDELMATVV